jgi:multidrug efflux pump subunit AcrA (membrane-fusion protein)
LIGERRKPFKLGDIVSKGQLIVRLEDLENLLSQIKIAKQNVANAQRTYDLNLTRYREGDITGMDMNQFQTQLSNKKIAYTQALINYKIELLNLKILSLYDFEHDVPIVPMEDLVTKK